MDVLMLVLERVGGGWAGKHQTNSSNMGRREIRCAVFEVGTSSGGGRAWIGREVQSKTEQKREEKNQDDSRLTD